MALDLHPYTLLLVTLVVLILKQIVSYVGKSTLQDFVWASYLKIGSKFNLNKSFDQWTAKKQELNEINKQKRLISAQDQYAKWTKLNRQADKLVAEIKTIEELINTNKDKINWYVSKLTLVLLTIPMYFIKFWYRKQVLFYLPKGVLPYPIEWVLSIPFFPLGTVGLTVWTFAVNTVIEELISWITFAFSSKPEKPVKETPKTKIEEIK